MLGVHYGHLLSGVIVELHQLFFGLLRGIDGPLLMHCLCNGDYLKRGRIDLLIINHFKLRRGHL